ncbi:Mom family adenine methylcarbamoylation protein [Larkinella arboricola]
MADINVKDIRVKAIDAKSATAFIRRHHYSGKVVLNSQLHFGCFHGDRLHGVLSFGPSLDKSKVIGLVAGTGWNEFVELNRMAFDEYLPRNAESRCIAVCIRLIKKHCPHIKWIISFADGTQCGDGTIYRASGFKLTGVTKNSTLLEFPGGERIAATTLTANGNEPAAKAIRAKYNIKYTGSAAVKPYLEAGGRYIPGYQFRYIYLIDKNCQLTVPVLPFSYIDEIGAGMYKGQAVPVRDRKE